MAASVPLSVVLATTEPWPDLANCLEVLEPLVAAVGGEIIVGDGHGGALKAARAAASSGRLTWIRMPGASVFDLRAKAVEAARGEIIATTEDHCLVDAHLCTEVLAAMRDHPEAMAVAGPVKNGSTARLIDWANFLHTFGSLLPPWNPHQRHVCPPNANVAYRRICFPPGPLPPGWMELELNPRLFRERLFHIQDAMTVTHVQSHGFWGTFRSHFDNGRSTTGLHHTTCPCRGGSFRGTCSSA